MSSARNKSHRALYLIDNIWITMSRENLKIQTLVVLDKSEVVILK